MAIQSTFRRTIHETETLMVTIECASCKKLRTFLIEANLTSRINRKQSAIKIREQCTSCKHMIEITIGWHPEVSGYSFNAVSTVGKVATVTDNAELGGYDDQPKEGGKRNNQ